MKKAMIFGAGLIAVSMCAGPSAFAQDVPAGSPAEVESPAPGTYEIHDPAESVPVNKRSESDPRFATQQQHDAEMYAEEYEKQHQQKEIERRQWLDKMNNLSGHTAQGIGNYSTGMPITGRQ